MRNPYNKIWSVIAVWITVFFAMVVATFIAYPAWIKMDRNGQIFVLFWVFLLAIFFSICAWKWE